LHFRDTAYKPAWQCGASPNLGETMKCNCRADLKSHKSIVMNRFTPEKCVSWELIFPRGQLASLIRSGKFSQFDANDATLCTLGASIVLCNRCYYHGTRSKARQAMVQQS
jgi:hypothetical protein